MPISGDRNLKAGTKLVARYKGHDYECEVGQGVDGSIVYNIDGEQFKSPSRAGTHVMGGIACNGWRFWSVKGSAEAEARPAAKPKAPKAKASKKAAKPKTKKATRKRSKTSAERPHPKAHATAMAKDNGAPAELGTRRFERQEDGRYFCSGCMDSFAVDDDLEPTTCPKGHSPIGAESEAAVVD